MGDLFRSQPDVWPWWIGGPLIGLYVVAFVLVQNRLLSASSTFQFVAERWIPRLLGKKPGERDWLVAADPATADWLGFFFVGLALGGLLGALEGGGFANDWTLPGLSAAYPWAAGWHAAVLLLAGLLIGFGTRMSGGCTSGHCIVGISGLQAPSALATGVFFACGIAVSFLVEWFVPKGGLFS